MDSYVLFVPEPKTKKQRRSPACAQCRRRKIGCDRGRPMCSNCIRLRRPQCSYPDGEVGYASIAESELRPLNHRNTSNPKKTGSAVGKNSNKRDENGLNVSSSVFQDGIMGDIAMIPVESSANTGRTNHADITAYDPSLLQQSASNGSTQGIPQTTSALALDDKMSPTTIQTSPELNSSRRNPASLYRLHLYLEQRRSYPLSSCSCSCLHRPTSPQH